MDTKYRLLYFDYWIQSFLGFLVLMLCITIVGLGFGIIGLIPLGAVQVLSGLIWAIFYKDRKRMVYLLIVALFFALWYAMYILIDYNYVQSLGFLHLILLFTPPSLGIWYFRLTAEEYKELKAQHDFKTFTEEQILDA